MFLALNHAYNFPVRTYPSLTFNNVTAMNNTQRQFFFKKLLVSHASLLRGAFLGMLLLGSSTFVHAQDSNTPGYGGTLVSDHPYPFSSDPTSQGTSRTWDLAHLGGSAWDAALDYADYWDNLIMGNEEPNELLVTISQELEGYPALDHVKYLYEEAIGNFMEVREVYQVEAINSDYFNPAARLQLKLLGKEVQDAKKHYRDAKHTFLKTALKLSEAEANQSK